MQIRTASGVVLEAAFPAMILQVIADGVRRAAERAHPDDVASGLEGRCWEATEVLVVALRDAGFRAGPVPGMLTPPWRIAPPWTWPNHAWAWAEVPEGETGAGRYYLDVTVTQFYSRWPAAAVAPYAEAEVRYGVRWPLWRHGDWLYADTADGRALREVCEQERERMEGRIAGLHVSMRGLAAVPGAEHQPSLNPRA